MKNSVILFISLLILSSCEPAKTCGDFHTGKFKYKNVTDGTAADVIITRTEEYQIESSESANYSDTFKIVWSSECEYYCVYESSSNPNRMPYSKFDTVFARIVDTNPNGYVFESLFLGKRPKGELIRIEE